MSSGIIYRSPRATSCNKPDWDGMGGFERCGRCVACTAPKRIEAIRQMFTIATATRPGVDEWDLLISIVKKYDGGTDDRLQR